jgi:hypothetical protein
LAETKEDYLKLIEKLLQKTHLLTDSRREYAHIPGRIIWKILVVRWLQQNFKKMLENKPKLKKNYIIYWFTLIPQDLDFGSGY